MIPVRSLGILSAQSRHEERPVMSKRRPRLRLEVFEERLVPAQFFDSRFGSFLNYMADGPTAVTTLLGQATNNESLTATGVVPSATLSVVPLQGPATVFQPADTAITSANDNTPPIVVARPSQFHEAGPDSPTGLFLNALNQGIPISTRSTETGASADNGSFHFASSAWTSGRTTGTSDDSSTNFGDGRVFQPAFEENGSLNSSIVSPTLYSPVTTTVVPVLLPARTQFDAGSYRNFSATDPRFDTSSEHDANSIDNLYFVNPEPQPFKPVGGDAAPTDDSSDSAAPTGTSSLSSGPTALATFWPATMQSSTTLAQSTTALSQFQSEFHSTVDPALAAPSASTPGSASLQPLSAILFVSNTTPLDIGITGRMPDRSSSSTKPPVWSWLNASDQDPGGVPVTLDAQPPHGCPVEGVTELDPAELDGQVSQVLNRIGSLRTEVGEGLEHPQVYYWIAAAGLLSAGAAYVVHVNRKLQRSPRLSFSRISLGHWQGEEHDTGNR